MNSPVGAKDPAMRALLDDLSGVLRRLHKALIEIEAENFGPVSGPFQLLNLVTNHPHFAWLQSLSVLMVELDESRDSDVINADTAAAFKAMLENLVGPRMPTQPQFRERYAAMLQQSAAVAMAHGELRRVLDKLPDRSPGELRE